MISGIACLSLLTMSLLAAADPAARVQSLEPFVEEETLALVRFDATKIDMNGLLKTLTNWLPERKEELADTFTNIKIFHSAFVMAGGTDATIIFSSPDLPLPSLALISLKKDAADSALNRFLRVTLDGWLLPQDTRGERWQIEKKGNGIVAGARATLTRFEKNKAGVRSELVPSVTAAGDLGIQVLFLPSRDHRRVIEEVVTLSPAFDDASGKIPMRGVQWAVLGFDLGAKPTIKLTVQCANAATATKLATLTQTSLAWLGKQTFFSEEPLSKHFPKEYQAAVAALTPTATGDRLTVTVSDPEALKSIAVLVASMVHRRFGRLLIDLDSEDYQVRRRAKEELQKIGQDAVPCLRQALSGDLSPETRRSIKELLAKVESRYEIPD